MKTLWSKISKRRQGLGKSAGSALVIVLAFIVLSAIIILGYLAGTQSSLKKSVSSGSMVMTDLLAESAIVAITDDLKQEMLAGADGNTVPATNDPMVVSQPWAMVPNRVVASGVILTNVDFFNLVKQSVRAKPFYSSTNSPATFVAKGSAAATTGRIRASAVSTADASRNGRILSPSRWNKPLLLGGSGFTSTNQLPDWILISRRGPLTNGASPGLFADKSASNDDFVIGRFAYNIYDVGGLLDINVAGFDPNGSGAQTNAAVKGSAAWADLSAIPGILNPEKIVKWRNKLSSANAVSYQNILQTWGEPNGFQKSYRTNGDIENRFFTRQDLLKYAQSYGSNAMATNALPFLTTFSVDTDQPSFVPEPSRPKVMRASLLGGNDAFGNDDSFNPSLISTKNSSGDPAIKRRFPLERLKYLVPNPNPATAQKIREYFGLEWNPSENGWNYLGAGDIKRLSSISAEPNFFELLQAAIDVGSLGGQFQLKDDIALDSPRVLGRRDGSTRNQIIQIGANIIDQYDSDGYPTSITFGGRQFSGIEDLPYLFGIRVSAYNDYPVQNSELVGVAPAPDGGLAMRCAVILQPTIWNPHTPTLSPSSRPTEFRITASGDVYTQARFDWWSGQTTRKYVTDIIPGTYLYPSNNPKDRTPQVQFDPDIDRITFQTSSSATFREAYTLTSRNYPAGSNANGPVVPVNEPDFNHAPGENSNEALGFLAGYLWAGPVWKNPPLPPPNDKDVRYFDTGLTVSSGGLDFALQYKDAENNWRTYDMMESVPAYDGIFQNNSGGRRPRSWTRIDPRSDRFGYRDFLYDVSVQWPQGQTFRPASTDGLTGFGNAPAPDSSTPNAGNLAAVNWDADRPGAWGLISQNKAGQTVRYRDPDGIQRLAMGGYSSGTAGLPLAAGGNSAASRPVILNRPFRSIAELGYAFRGMPWKQLDFFTPESGDAALLDVFCLYESSTPEKEPLVAGKVNLNSRRSEVLQAMLRGTALSSESPASTTISTNEAKVIADQMVAWTRSTNSNQGPLRNRSEVVGRYVSTNYSGFSANAATNLASTNQPFSFRRQSIMRALVDGGTTRTWTFLIDLIVQTGRYPKDAALLTPFSVEGEQRYWVHVAVDRYTGKVISQIVEAVNE